jgi:hypothetical protein
MIMYKLQKTIKVDGSIGEPVAVIRFSDNACIPFAVDNTDYQTFKKDLADGVELQNADGVVIDGIAYLATLES